MTTKLILNADDYLTHLLFSVSVSKDAKKKRRKSWLVITGLSFFVAIAFYMGNDFFLSSYALVVGIITLLFYPYYQKISYQNFYKKHVYKNYQYRFGKESQVNFQHDCIEVENETYQAKLFTNEIEKITEIGTHFFIEFKVGGSLIIPKKQVDQEIFLSGIISIFKNPQISVEKNLQWKWK